MGRLKKVGSRLPRLGAPHTIPAVTDVLLLLGGLVLLIGGAELMVRGAVWLAMALGVRPMVVGLTVVAFGTSAPELVVSMIGAFQDRSGLAVGTVFGSNVANVLLILGLAAVCSPIRQAPESARFELGVLALSTLLTVVALALGELERIQGGLLMALLVWFVWRLVRERKDLNGAEGPARAPSSAWASLLRSLSMGLGIAALGFGADLLVRGATGLAKGLGLSDTAVAAIFVALGTSLPELATSVVAALRGHSEIALGNVIGSNVFNVCWVLGATACIVPLPIGASDRFHVLAGLAATLGLLAVLRVRRGVGRVAGAVMLAAYAAYLGSTVRVG